MANDREQRRGDERGRAAAGEQHSDFIDQVMSEVRAVKYGIDRPGRADCR